MILCITEKPSVARDIARILGATSRHDGYLEGNGYRVSWTFGHLCTLKEPHDYLERWKHWSLGSLPMVPPRFGIKLIDDKGIEKQFRVLEQLIRDCDEVVNCGDAGQEGELIQRWVMQKAGCNKPVKRLWISSLTDEAIQEGFQSLKPSEELDTVYSAGLCRAIGDWLLGMNATRLYSLKYSVPGKVLSVGRVQTPTLAMVVKRQLEIDNFVPVDSWTIRTLYRDVYFDGDFDNFPTEEKASEAISQIREEQLVVTDVSKKKGTEGHPRLFDLTSLQVECNKTYSMSAEDTLKTIQSLYEKKLTTYPRVDTTYLTDDVYPKCGPILNSLTPYAPLLTPLRGKKLRKSKKVFDNSKVTDHHAIIPTGQPIPNGLSLEEKRVFDLIAKRFISVFYPDCTFEQTTVKAKVGKLKFKTTGKVILEPGWRQVYASANTPSDDAKDLLPPFTKGESGPHKPEIVKKTTQPPKFYTEGTLLKAMETAGSVVEDEDLRDALKANGIGRPSTRANIIQTLYKRGYIVKKGKSLRATQAGIELIQIIHEDLLKSPELTGRWERKLREIERGDYQPADFINAQKELINGITLSVLRDNSNRKIMTND